MQVCDRYLALARDASSSGDRIKAEGYLQHAEHYYRVVNGDEGQQGQNQAQGQAQGQGRFNGRRNSMVSPAEIALSGEQAPVFHTKEQTQPAPEAAQETPPRTDAPVTVSETETETTELGASEESQSTVEETSDADKVESEGDTATGA